MMQADRTLNRVPAVLGLAFLGLILVCLLAPTTARAQDELTITDGIIGSRLALKVLLSSEDALSASRYDMDTSVSGLDAEAQQIGIRLRVGDRPSRPFVGAFAGRYVEEETLALEAIGHSFESDFEAVTVGVEAGADVLLAGAERTKAGSWSRA